MTTEHRKAKVAVEGDREIHIERVFDAPRDRVFEAMERGLNETYDRLDAVLAG
jgi:hypothetical protein